MLQEFSTKNKFFSKSNFLEVYAVVHYNGGGVRPQLFF